MVPKLLPRSVSRSPRGNNRFSLDLHENDPYRAKKRSKLTIAIQYYKEKWSRHDMLI